MVLTSPYDNEPGYKRLGLRGLTPRGMRSTPVLYLMHGFTLLGIALATAYPLRILIKSPEVIIDKKNNPEPHHRFLKADDGGFIRYKFWSPLDYSKMRVPKERPEME